jgi:hypothetical protein
MGQPQARHLETKPTFGDNKNKNARRLLDRLEVEKIGEHGGSDPCKKGTGCRYDQHCSHEYSISRVAQIRLRSGVRCVARRSFQEIADAFGDLAGMRFYGKVASV